MDEGAIGTGCLREAILWIAPDEANDFVAVCIFAFALAAERARQRAWLTNDLPIGKREINRRKSDKGAP